MIAAHRVVWPEAGKVALEEYEIGPPGEREVQLATVCTLLSPGTERAWLLGLPNTPRRYPSRPGYNSVGRVTAVGSGVQSLAVGDIVGSGAGHASAVNVAEERAVKLPDGLKPEIAVFFTMGCIALQGVRKARIELGEGVAVIGQGLVGQLALQFARLEGGLPAIGMDLSESRRALSLRCGADLALDPRDAAFREQLAVATGGEGPAVVIEATGSPEPVKQALELAGRCGRIVLLGSTRGTSDDVNFYKDVHCRGLHIIGAHANVRPARDRSPGYWPWRQDAETIMRLMAARRLAIEPLISDRVPWHRSTQVYERLAAWDDGLLGVVLDWTV
jgi:2-desacetyl-2-hydroxyethyl bacteriochlorophyllide A dehydrogenase